MCIIEHRGDRGYSPLPNFRGCLINWGSGIVFPNYKLGGLNRLKFGGNS